MSEDTALPTEPSDMNNVADREDLTKTRSRMVEAIDDNIEECETNMTKAIDKSAMKSEAILVAEIDKRITASEASIMAAIDKRLAEHNSEIVDEVSKRIEKSLTDFTTRIKTVTMETLEALDNASNSAPRSLNISPSLHGQNMESRPATKPRLAPQGARMGSIMSDSSHTVQQSQPVTNMSDFFPTPLPNTHGPASFPGPFGRPSLPRQCGARSRSRQTQRSNGPARPADQSFQNQTPNIPLNQSSRHQNINPPPNKPLPNQVSYAYPDGFRAVSVGGSGPLPGPFHPIAPSTDQTNPVQPPHIDPRSWVYQPMASISGPDLTQSSNTQGSLPLPTNMEVVLWRPQLTEENKGRLVTAGWKEYAKFENHFQPLPADGDLNNIFALDACYRPQFVMWCDLSKPLKDAVRKEFLADPNLHSDWYRKVKCSNFDTCAYQDQTQDHIYLGHQVACAHCSKNGKFCIRRIGDLVALAPLCEDDRQWAKNRLMYFQPEYFRFPREEGMPPSAVKAMRGLRLYPEI